LSDYYLLMHSIKVSSIESFCKGWIFISDLNSLSLVLGTSKISLYLLILFINFIQNHHYNSLILQGLSSLFPISFISLSNSILLLSLILCVILMIYRWCMNFPSFFFSFLIQIYSLLPPHFLLLLQLHLIQKTSRLFHLLWNCFIKITNLKDQILVHCKFLWIIKIQLYFINSKYS
jgi:hypothetical protein